MSTSKPGKLQPKLKYERDGLNYEIFSDNSMLVYNDKDVYLKKDPVCLYSVRRYTKTSKKVSRIR